MLAKRHSLVLATAASVALALSGCGGGDASARPDGEDQVIGVVVNAVQEDQVVAAAAAGAISKAASAKPRSGSVTQSSNVDVVNSVTIDQVVVTAEYGTSGPSFIVTNGVKWKISTSDGNPTRFPEDRPPWQATGVSKSISDATLYVDVYTDIEAPTDADYLAGGVWLVVPDDGSRAADYVFGAFADGNDPFRQTSLAALTGTATYAGDATGVFSEEQTDDSTHIGFFEGDVTLTADFVDANDLGRIEGSITNIEVDGVPEGAKSRLILNIAEIGSQSSGFFTASLTGHNNDFSRAYGGRWGGQFFGNGEVDGYPGSVAGTFGGQSDDDAVSFVGVFGAHKEKE